jgi:hypothetical protein
MALCGSLDLSFDECQQAEIDRCLAKDPAHFAKRNEAKLREVDAALTPGSGEGSGTYELRRKLDHLWICSGCGTRKSLEQIKGEAPQAISCCPERKMVPPSSVTQPNSETPDA